MQLPVVFINISYYMMIGSMLQKNKIIILNLKQFQD